MSQRNSEYARIPGDLYVTPKWVWEALYEVEPWARQAWDCAPINATFDFLEGVEPRTAIATNPPFKLAEEFCWRAINRTRPFRGKVAMLLPHAFDAAKTRVGLFNHPFKIKYTITKRIRWDNLEQKKAGPSLNHAWYVWDYDYSGPPLMGWLPITPQDRGMR